MQLQIDGLGDVEAIAGGRYRARQSGLDRDVLVRVVDGDDSVAQRVDQHVTALGTLAQDPRFVSFLGTGTTADGGRYLLFEPCHSSLAELLVEDGALPVEWACDTISVVAGAVATAHEAGLVQGRLGLEDVLVDGSGQLRVWFDRVPSDPPPSPATDVLSLGSMLLELLAGRRSGFEGDVMPDGRTPRPHLADSLAELRSGGAPESVCGLIESCIHPDPARRPSAREVAGHLGGIAVIEAEPDAPPELIPAEAPSPAPAQHEAASPAPADLAAPAQQEAPARTPDVPVEAAGVGADRAAQISPDDVGETAPAALVEGAPDRVAEILPRRVGAASSDTDPSPVPALDGETTLEGPAVAAAMAELGTEVGRAGAAGADASASLASPAPPAPSVRYDPGDRLSHQARLRAGDLEASANGGDRPAGRDAAGTMDTTRVGSDIAPAGDRSDTAPAGDGSDTDEPFAVVSGPVATGDADSGDNGAVVVATPSWSDGVEITAVFGSQRQDGLLEADHRQPDAAGPASAPPPTADQAAGSVSPTEAVRRAVAPPGEPVDGNAGDGPTSAHPAISLPAHPAPRPTIGSGLFGSSADLRTIGTEPSGRSGRWGRSAGLLVRAVGIAIVTLVLTAVAVGAVWSLLGPGRDSGDSEQVAADLAPASPSEGATGDGSGISIVVPDVEGESELEARSRLAVDGFEVDVDYVDDSSQADGTVIEQDPEPGARIESGSEVRLVVARSATTTSAEPSTTAGGVSRRPRVTAAPPSTTPPTNPPTLPPTTSPPPTAPPPTEPPTTLPPTTLPPTTLPPTTLPPTEPPTTLPPTTLPPTTLPPITSPPTEPPPDPQPPPPSP